MRWTPTEDRALVTTISDLLDLGGWKADNGQLKNGAWAKVESIMQLKLSGCNKKAKPHIDSCVKLLRKQYDAITEILGPSASSFGWNDEGKFVTCPQTVCDDWVKVTILPSFIITRIVPAAASLNVKQIFFCSVLKYIIFVF